VSSGIACNASADIIASNRRSAAAITSSCDMPRPRSPGKTAARHRLRIDWRGRAPHDNRRSDVPDDL
jgi:hypothetical protein